MMIAYLVKIQVHGNQSNSKPIVGYTRSQRSKADTLLISQEEFDFGALTPLMYSVQNSSSALTVHSVHRDRIYPFSVRCILYSG